MVAKVSKSSKGIKNQPHVRTMTKTIVKKKKNKASSETKNVKLKIKKEIAAEKIAFSVKKKKAVTGKKKKISDMKEKAITEKATLTGLERGISSGTKKKLENDQDEIVSNSFYIDVAGDINSKQEEVQETVAEMELTGMKKETVLKKKTTNHKSTKKKLTEGKKKAVLKKKTLPGRRQKASAGMKKKLEKEDHEEISSFFYFDVEGEKSTRLEDVLETIPETVDSSMGKRKPPHELFAGDGEVPVLKCTVAPCLDNGINDSKPQISLDVPSSLNKSRNNEKKSEKRLKGIKKKDKGLKKKLEKGLLKEANKSVEKKSEKVVSGSRKIGVKRITKKKAKGVLKEGNKSVEGMSDIAEKKKIIKVFKQKDKGIAKKVASVKEKKVDNDLKRNLDNEKSPGFVSKSYKRNRAAYKKMKKEERKLALDLFGDDAEVDGDEEGMEEAVAVTLHKKSQAVDDKIPVDPFDIHNIEVSESVRKPAWVDEDDETIRVMDVVASMTKSRGQRGIRETSEKKYEVDLREKFSQVIGSTPDWAELKQKPQEDSDDNDEIIRRTGNYLSENASLSLPKMSLEYKQMNDLNSSHTEGAFIQAVEFNPRLQVGLVAGSLKYLGAASLFQVDGKANHRIHSVRFPNYTVSCARFMQDGKRFVVGSGMYNHFYVYDMETSKETKLYVKEKYVKGVKKNLYVSPDGELLIFLGDKGKIYIYDATAFSLIDIMEAPHPITSATFNYDGSRMYTHGLTGEICIWDMHARECVHKFFDEGCIAGDAIAIAPNNQYLACGSRSGIVNIYDVAALSSYSPAPVKILSNLTTSITALTFNASSEILAMASNHLDNAVKLVHFPSMTVFENFPRPGSVMKRTEVLQFSPQSGYLAVGNYAGAAALYRLKHFSSY